MARRIFSLASLIGLTTLGLAGGAASVAPAAPPADPAAGALVFRKCAACHSVAPSGRNGIGPNLHGVVGRRAGRVPGFSYSPALKASGIVWTDQALAHFLASPRKAVPGTRMAFIGIPNPQDQANLIAYLRQTGAKGATK